METQSTYDIIIIGSGSAGQREAVRLTQTFVQHHEYERIIDSPIQPLPENLSSDAALNAWINQAAVTGHHVVGTCKMGPSADPMAVVDQFGQVHGLGRAARD